MSRWAAQLTYTGDGCSDYRQLYLADCIQTGPQGCQLCKLRPPSCLAPAGRVRLGSLLTLYCYLQALSCLRCARRRALMLVHFCALLLAEKDTAHHLCAAHSTVLAAMLRSCMSTAWRMIISVQQVSRLASMLCADLYMPARWRQQRSIAWQHAIVCHALLGCSACSEPPAWQTAINLQHAMP